MKAIVTWLMAVVLTACAISEGAALAAAEGVRKFAFGTPTSVTRTGFAKVTVKDAFTPEKGYGFQSAQGLEAFDRGGSKIELPKDSYTASVYGAYRTTSDITCALVEGRSDNAFLAALPDGDYTVWVIASDAEWDPPLFEVWAGGQKKLDVRIPRARFVFMEPFQARASGGQLRIELKGRHGWILSGLVIGREGPELADVVAKLHRDVFFLTEQELPKWKEAKYTMVNPPLELTPEERQRGYVVFPVDYTEQIVPAYIPPRTAIGKPLSALATPGEFEPATLCVSAQKELGNVAVELSDFVGEKGQSRISRENVSVGVVRCWPQRASDWGGQGEYHVVPEMIEPPVGRACRVQAGQLKQWWLTVHVPPDTPAGRYRMALCVRPEKAPPTVLEWRLLVLPFSLSRPADKHWGALLGGFPWAGALDGPERRGRNLPAEVDRLTRADVADYGDHGFDLVLMNYYFGVKENPDGTFTYGLSTLPRDLDYLKRLGSSAPMVICFEYTCRELEYRFAEPGKKHVPGTFSPKARKAIVGLVRHIHDEAQRQGWPKLYYYPIDEPGNNKTENRYQFAENVLDFVHEVPGCQTAITVTADCVRRLGDRVDVRIYAYGYYNRDKVLQEARQGHPFWYYENGMFYAHGTLASRGLTGLQFLRSGAEVATAWGFSATNANPYNDFDGGHKDWNVVFPGVDGPTPTIYWELCREGLDDCRYVATLQRQIRQAREQGKTEPAQRAERVLEPLLAADAPTIDNPLAFGRYRWRIAREILALRGDRELALPFAAVADNPPRPNKIGPNLVENPSFEAPPQADGLPSGRYHIGYPSAKEKPVGALRVTDEAAHSGRFSLKWDLSKVADAKAASRDPRYLTVNVGVSSDTVKSLRGKRFKVGYWLRVGGGAAVPGLGLRQNLKQGPGEAFYYRGGVEDPAVWNHFETEGRFSNDLESMDIHTWCTIPEAELAKKCFFYIDDVSLEVIEEPPLAISTPLDEYYSGQPIPWTVNTTSSTGQIKIALLGGERLVVEETRQARSGPLRGTFAGGKLTPGIYTLQATITAPQQAPQAARRQVIVAPNPFDWRQPTLAAAAPKNMMVYGRAPVGAFGVDTLEHVEGGAKLGMTLLYSYSPDSARKQLDLNDPMGKAVAKHKMQVMYPLCGRFTQVRLAREINPTDATISVVGEKADSVISFPKSGYLMIEGERIEYATRTADAFGGCRRGAGGTRAAPHGAGLLLCDSDALRKEILAVKDAPGLWGYWLVDDSRPREIDSLREMSRIIRLTDRDAQGRPNSHVIVMGIGGSSAMANFDVGICDALGVYPYPYHAGKLDTTTRNQMRFIMTRARSLQPDIGLIGIYQAFGCGEALNSPQWKNMPTPEQVREDMLSFYDWGADGVMAFIYHWHGKNNKEPQGLDAVPEVRDTIGRTHQEILAGKIKRTVPPVGKREWLTILTGPEAKPSPGGKPAYDLDDPAKLASLVNGRPNRLSAEPFAVEGRSYPLKVSLPAWNRADPKSDRWPIAQFAAGDLTTTDWAQVGALEQPIYNPGDQTIVVLISLEDTAKGWWQRSVEIPPRVPMLLRVPMDEARLSVDPGHIQRWLLWEADSPVAVQFRLGTPMLAPGGKK